MSKQWQDADWQPHYAVKDNGNKNPKEFTDSSIQDQWDDYRRNLNSLKDQYYDVLGKGVLNPTEQDPAKLEEVRKKLKDLYWESLKRNATRGGKKDEEGTIRKLFEDTKVYENYKDVLHEGNGDQDPSKADILAKIRQTESIMNRMKDDPSYVGKPRTDYSKMNEPGEKPQQQPEQHDEVPNLRKQQEQAFNDSIGTKKPESIGDTLIKQMQPPKQPNITTGGGGNVPGFQLNPERKGMSKEDMEDQYVPAILGTRKKIQEGLKAIEAEKATLGALPEQERIVKQQQLEKGEKDLQKNLEDTNLYNADIANWKFRQDVNGIKTKAVGIDGKNVIVPNQDRNKAELDVNFLARLHDLTEYEKKNGTLDPGVSAQDVADGIIGGQSIWHSLVGDQYDKFHDKYKSFFDNYTRSYDALNVLQGQWSAKGGRKAEQDYEVPDVSGMSDGSGGKGVVPKVARGVSVPMSELSWGFNEGGTKEGNRKAMADLWQNASDVTIGALAKPIAGIFSMAATVGTGGATTKSPSFQSQQAVEEGVKAIGSTAGRLGNAFSGQGIVNGVFDAFNNNPNGDWKVIKDIGNLNIYNSPTAEQTKEAIGTVSPGQATQEAMEPADNALQTIASEVSKGVMSIGFGELAAAGKLATWSGEVTGITKGFNRLAKIEKVTESMDGATVMANRIARELNVVDAHGAKAFEEIVAGTDKGRTAMNMAKMMVPPGAPLSEAAHLATTLAIQAVAQHSDHLTTEDIKQGVIDGTLFAVANYGFGKAFSTIGQRVALANKAGVAPEIAERINSYGKFGSVLGMMGAMPASSHISQAINSGDWSKVFDMSDYMNRQTVIDMTFGAIGFKDHFLGSANSAEQRQQFRDTYQDAIGKVARGESNPSIIRNLANSVEPQQAPKVPTEPLPLTGKPIEVPVPTVKVEPTIFTPQEIGKTANGSPITESHGGVVERISADNRSVTNVIDALRQSPESRLTADDHATLDIVGKQLGGKDADAIRFVDAVPFTDPITGKQGDVPAKLGADGKMYISKDAKYSPDQITGALVEELVHKATVDKIKTDGVYATELAGLMSEFKNRINTDVEVSDAFKSIVGVENFQKIMDYHLGDLSQLPALIESIGGTFNRNTGILETMRVADAIDKAKGSKVPSLLERFVSLISRLFKGNAKVKGDYANRAFDFLRRAGEEQAQVEPTVSEYGALSFARALTGKEIEPADLKNEEFMRASDLLRQIIATESYDPKKTVVKNNILDEVVKQTEGKEALTGVLAETDFQAKSNKAMEITRDPVKKWRNAGMLAAQQDNKDYSILSGVEQMKYVGKAIDKAHKIDPHAFSANYNLLQEMKEFIGEKAVYKEESKTAVELLQNMANLATPRQAVSQIADAVKQGADGYKEFMAGIRENVIADSKNPAQAAKIWDMGERKLYRNMHNTIEQIPLTLDLTQGTLVPIKGETTANRKRVKNNRQYPSGLRLAQAEMRATMSMPYNQDTVTQNVIDNITNPDKVGSIQETVAIKKITDTTPTTTDGLDVRDPKELFDTAFYLATNPHIDDHYLIIPNGTSGNMAINIKKSYNAIMGMGQTPTEQLGNLHKLEGALLWSVIDNQVMQGDAARQGRFGDMPRVYDILNLHKAINMDGKSIETLTASDMLRKDVIAKGGYTDSNGNFIDLKTIRELHKDRKPQLVEIADKMNSIYTTAHKQPLVPFSYRYMNDDGTFKKRDNTNEYEFHLPSQFFTLMMAFQHKVVDPGAQQYINAGVPKLSKYMEKYYGLYTSASYNYFKEWKDVLIAAGDKYDNLTDDDYKHIYKVQTSDDGIKHLKMAILDVDQHQLPELTKLQQLLGKISTDGSGLFFHRKGLELLGDILQAESPGHIKTANVRKENGLTQAYKGDLHFIDIDHYKDMLAQYPELEPSIGYLIKMADHLASQGIFGIVFSTTIKGKGAYNPGVSADGFRYNQEGKVIGIPKKDGTFDTDKVALEVLNMAATQAILGNGDVPDYAIMKQDLHGEQAMGFISSSGNNITKVSAALGVNVHPRTNQMTEFGRAVLPHLNVIEDNLIEDFAKVARGGHVVMGILDKLNNKPTIQGTSVTAPMEQGTLPTDIDFNQMNDNINSSKGEQIPLGINTNEYTNHSGGAEGSDIQWDTIGRKFGFVNNNHYWTETKTPHGNTEISKEDFEEGRYESAKAAKRNFGYQYATMKDSRLIRNWSQVKHSDAVFAIGTIVATGERIFPNQKSDTRTAQTPSVTGGTGYAVGMAINNNKPTYVFNQSKSDKYDIGWYEWNGDDFIRIGVPTLTKNFAGIGTREINDAGLQAIKDVFEKTLATPNIEQPSYMRHKPLLDQEQLDAGTFLNRIADRIEAMERSDFSGIDKAEQISHALRMAVDETGRVIERNVPSLALYEELFGKEGAIATVMADEYGNAQKSKSVGTNLIVMPGLADVADAYYLRDVILEKTYDDIYDDMFNSFDSRPHYWRKEWDRLFAPNADSERIPFPYYFNEQHVRLFAEAYTLEHKVLLDEMIAKEIDPETGQYIDGGQGITIGQDAFYAMNRMLRKMGLKELTIGSYLFSHRTPPDEIDSFTPVYLMGISKTNGAIITNKKLMLEIYGADHDGDAVGITIPSTYWIDADGVDHYSEVWKIMTAMGLHKGIKAKDKQPQKMDALNKVLTQGSEANTMITLADGSHPRDVPVVLSPLQPGHTEAVYGTMRDIGILIENIRQVAEVYQNMGHNFTPKGTDRYEWNVKALDNKKGIEGIKFVFDESIIGNFSMLKQIGAVDMYVPHTINIDDLYYGTFVGSVKIYGTLYKWSEIRDEHRESVKFILDKMVTKFSGKKEVLPIGSAKSVDARMQQVTANLDYEGLQRFSPNKGVYNSIAETIAFEVAKYSPTTIKKVHAILNKLSMLITPLVSIPTKEKHNGTETTKPWNYLTQFNAKHYAEKNTEEYVRVAMRVLFRHAINSGRTSVIARDPNYYGRVLTSDAQGIGFENEGTVMYLKDAFTEDGLIAPEFKEFFKTKLRRVSDDDSSIVFEPAILNAIKIAPLNTKEAGYLLGNVVAAVSKHYENDSLGRLNADDVATKLLIAPLEGTNVGYVNADYASTGTLLNHTRTGSYDTDNGMYSNVASIFGGLLRQGVVPVDSEGTPLKAVISEGIADQAYEEYGALNLADYVHPSARKAILAITENGSLDYSDIDSVTRAVDRVKQSFKDSFGADIDETSLNEVLNQLTPTAAQEYALSKNRYHTQGEQAANFANWITRIAKDLEKIQRQIKASKPPTGIVSKFTTMLGKKFEGVAELWKQTVPYKHTNATSLIETLAEDTIPVMHTDKISTRTAFVDDVEEVSHTVYGDLLSVDGLRQAPGMVSWAGVTIYPSAQSVKRTVDDGLFNIATDEGLLRNILAETVPNFELLHEAVHVQQILFPVANIVGSSEGTALTDIRGSLDISTIEGENKTVEVDFNDLNRTKKDIDKALGQVPIGIRVGKMLPRYKRNNEPLEDNPVLPLLRHFTTEVALDYSLWNAHSQKNEAVAGLAFHLARENAQLNSEPIYLTDIPTQKHYQYNPDGTIENMEEGTIDSVIKENTSKGTYHLSSKLENKFTDQEHHDYVASLMPEEYDKAFVLHSNTHEDILHPDTKFQGKSERQIRDAAAHVIIGEVQARKFGMTSRRVLNELDFLMTRHPDANPDIVKFYERTRYQLKQAISQAYNDTKNFTVRAMRTVPSENTVKAQKVLENFMAGNEDNREAWTELARRLYSGYSGQEVEHLINLGAVRAEVMRGIRELKSINHVNQMTEAHKEEAMPLIDVEFSKEDILTALGYNDLVETNLTHLFNRFKTNLRHQLTAAEHIATSLYADRRDPNRQADKLITDSIGAGGHKGAELEIVDENIQEHVRQSRSAFMNGAKFHNPIEAGTNVVIQYNNNAGDPVRAQGVYIGAIPRVQNGKVKIAAVIVDADNRKALIINYDNIKIFRSKTQYSSMAVHKALVKLLHKSKGDLADLLAEITTSSEVIEHSRGTRLASKYKTERTSSALVNTIVELSEKSHNFMTHLSTTGLKLMVMSSYMHLGAAMMSIVKAGIIVGTTGNVLSMIDTLLVGFGGTAAKSFATIIENFVSAGRIYKDMDPVSFWKHWGRMFGTKTGLLSMMPRFGVGTPLPVSLQHASEAVSSKLVLGHNAGAQQHVLMGDVETGHSTVGIGHANSPQNIARQQIEKMGVFDKGLLNQKISWYKWLGGKQLEGTINKHTKEFIKSLGDDLLEVLTANHELKDLTDLAIKQGFEWAKEGYQAHVVNGEIQVTYKGMTANDVRGLRIKFLDFLVGAVSLNFLQTSEVYSTGWAARIIALRLHQDNPDFQFLNGIEQERQIEQLMYISQGRYDDKPYLHKYGMGKAMTMFSPYKKSRWLYQNTSAIERKVHYDNYSLLLGTRGTQWLLQGDKVPNPNKQLKWWLFNGSVTAIGKASLSAYLHVSLLTSTVKDGEVKQSTKQLSSIYNKATGYFGGSDYGHNPTGQKISNTFLTENTTAEFLVDLATAITVPLIAEDMYKNDHGAITNLTAKSRAKVASDRSGETLSSLPIGMSQRSLVSIAARAAELSLHYVFPSDNRIFEQAEEKRDKTAAWDMAKDATHVSPYTEFANLPLQAAKEVVQHTKER